MTEPLIFDADEITIPVEVSGDKYILHEASGDAVCKYRNAMVACMEEIVDGKPRKIKNIADTEPLLVSLCLRDANGRLVPESKIRSWPNRIKTKLYETIKAISEMEEVEESIESLEKKLEEAKDKEETAKNE